MVAVPDGFEVPVCQALLRPRLLWGAPRGVTLLTMVGMGLAFIWSSWPAFPLLAAFQGVAILGTVLDEDWSSIALRVLRYKRYYAP